MHTTQPSRLGAGHEPSSAAERSVLVAISYDLVLTDERSEETGIEQIKRLLQDKGIIFRPW